MNLYVIRHGKTQWNLDNRLQGHKDNVLSVEGRLEAKKVSKKLKAVSFDYIISSPLKRALETAEIISESTNIILDHRLKERNYGDLEGKQGKDIDINLLWDIDKEYTEHQVETLDSFFKRVYSFIDECKKKYNDKTILLSTHSGTSILIECYFNGISKNLLSLSLDNCEVKYYKV